MRERQKAEAFIGEGGADNIPSHFALATGDRVLAGPEEGPTALLNGLHSADGKKKDTHRVNWEGPEDGLNKNGSPGPR